MRADFDEVRMNYVIYDDQYRDNFYPLTLTRSTGDLRVGILKLRQRIASLLGIERYTLAVSDDLQALYRERFSNTDINRLRQGDTYFVNSRLKISKKIAERILNLPENSAYLYKDTVIAARMNVESSIDSINAAKINDMLNSLEKKAFEEDALWNYTWQLISENAAYIEQDFEEYFYDNNNRYEVEPGVAVLNPYNVWIGEGCVLKPGVVIDASEGVVVLDEGCQVGANAVISGPVYVGKKSVVKTAARISEGTTIGPVCKVGGEVEGTIFQAYSNKQHDGFLGHSYIGEWVNLGANTNNSDLKNNYKTIKAFFYPVLDKIDTGCLFYGSVIGDHTKTGISTVINTGTIIGAGCNLIGSSLIKDFIRSFSWGSSDSLTRHKLSRFFETAAKVKQRRGLSLSEAEKNVYRTIYERIRNE